MKHYIIVFLAVTIFQTQSFAQDAANGTFSNLAASKNGNRERYPIGTRLLIRYASDNSEKKVRGTIAGLSSTEIFIQPKKKEDSLIKLNINGITLVRKINPKRKKIYGIVGTVLVAGGIAIVGSGGDSPGSAMKGALAIPLIGAGSYFLFAIPITLLIEKAREKRSSNGWKFQSQ
jgi:hypothetical protein